MPPATTPVMGVAGAAYTNNDLDPDTATLFDLDTAADQPVVQSPANAGALALTGKLLVDAGPGRRVRHLQPRRLRDHPGQPRLRHRLGARPPQLLPGQPAHRQGSRIGSFRPSAQVADIAIPLGQG